MNLHLLKCSLKGYDHISDLLFAKHWVITGCKYSSCKSLTMVAIYGEISKIGESTFGGCPSLRNVVISGSVTSIGKGAFGSASSLSELHCYATTPPSITSNSFCKTACKLYVPKGCKAAYEASDWKDFFGEIIEMEE